MNLIRVGEYTLTLGYNDQNSIDKSHLKPKVSLMAQTFQDDGWSKKWRIFMIIFKSLKSKTFSFLLVYIRTTERD